MKARAITRAELDARTAAEAAERDQAEAIATIRDYQGTLARLTLALVTVVWPRLTDTEKQQVRNALPDADERRIRAALEQQQGAQP